MDASALKSLLLDILSPARDVSLPVVEKLTAEDWAMLLDMTRQHRLGPLLHWTLTRQRQDLPVPAECRDVIAASFRKATLRSLLLQRELQDVHSVLDKAGIRHVALKGAYLAFHSYEHPALRPLRDLDILVPKEQALLAFQLLIDHGLERIDKKDGDLNAALEVAHQLPPIRGKLGKITVEVHARLFHRHDDEITDEDLSDDPQFWARVAPRPTAGADIPFESATDLLLHMIVHAVYDHQFNNGPLLLTDLAGLIGQQQIDWPLFWDLAAHGHHTRGCVLALKLLERYWGKQAIVWPEGAEKAFPAMPLDEAALLMLCDPDAYGDISFGSKVARNASLSEKAKLLFTKAFIPRQAIAAVYPVSATSPIVYFWYPVYWWRLATQRVPEYLRSRHQPKLQSEVQQLGSLEKWLSAH